MYNVLTDGQGPDLHINTYQSALRSGGMWMCVSFVGFEPLGAVRHPAEVNPFIHERKLPYREYALSCNPHTHTHTHTHTFLIPLASLFLSLRCALV